MVQYRHVCVDTFHICVSLFRGGRAAFVVILLTPCLESTLCRYLFSLVRWHTFCGVQIARFYELNGHGAINMVKLTDVCACMYVCQAVHRSQIKGRWLPGKQQESPVGHFRSQSPHGHRATSPRASPMFLHTRYHGR